MVAQRGLFIGGSWREASGGATFPVEDPATEQVLTQVSEATPTDAVRAGGALPGTSQEPDGSGMIDGS